MSLKPHVALIMDDSSLGLVYGRRERNTINYLCNMVSEPLTAANFRDKAEELKKVEILFTGWGCPRLDEETLSLFPGLAVVLYAAGSLKSVVTDTFWEREIAISSAWAINAEPVAEYTFAQIILCLKHMYHHVRYSREQRTFARRPDLGREGVFNAKVGLVSLGEIGRRVAARMRSLDVEVLAYDPFYRQDEVEELGIRLVDLEDLFEECDIVSVHTPNLPETKGLITGELIDKLRVGGSLINTSRGAVIDEPAMIEVLQRRPDLFAVLDVSDPEPPAEDSPLYFMTNVFLTPHIAGSIDRECARMGKAMIKECRRYLSDSPLKFQITKDAFQTMA